MNNAEIIKNLETAKDRFVSMEAKEYGIPGKGYYPTGRKENVVVIFEDERHIVPKWVQVIHGGVICGIYKFRQIFDSGDTIRYFAGKYEFQHISGKTDEVFYRS